MTNAEYETARAEAIAHLERLCGPDACVPLADVARLLPVNPEWERYCKPSRLTARRQGRRYD